ncbi:CHAT domain-containing protein [Balneolaceae bacterium YR4-1]|uniref:CHAT domain-containing protein n=1 Tax=Halalkalibaculum roseum TaxID=2709311 RepID=A0A6M1SS75_9BACT|nr:CHAT domain-containing protein [Halalkalibaculum roseum]NGP77929.1 CHAT domain-containing protein [Halalkalibaculum roseum]
MHPRKIYPNLVLYYRQAVCGLVLLLAGVSITVAQPNPSYSIDSLQAANKFKQGQELFAEANYDSSLTLLSQAANYYEEAEKWSRLAESYNLMSTNYRILNQLEESESLSRNVLEILDKPSLEQPVQRAKALNNLSLIETDRSNFQTAIALLDEALEVAREPVVPAHMRAMILGNLGSVYDEQGDFERALEWYSKGINLLDNNGSQDERKQLAKIYNYAGVTHVKMGRFEEALQFYNKELEINLDLFGSSHPSVAGGYNNIGGIYYRSGDIGEAIVYFKRAASSTELTFGENHPRVGLIYNNIGACYYEIGNYSESIKYLKRSAEIKKETQGADHPDLALTYNNIGSIYTEMEQYEEAIDYLNRSLNIRIRALGENHPVLSNNYNSLGLLYLETERFEKAIDHFTKALSITEETRGPNHPYAAEAKTNLAKSYRMKGDYSKALMHLKEAEKSLSLENGSDIEFRYPTYAVDVLNEIGKTLHEEFKSDPTRGLNQLKSALATYTRLSELLDAMQNKFLSEESKLLVSSRSHEIYESAIDVSYDLYNETGNQKFISDVFFFSEKSKARVILELLNDKKAQKYAGVPDTLIAYEQDLREQLSGVQQTLNSRLSSSGSDSPVDSLQSSLFKLHQELNKHIEMLSKEYPKYHSFKYKTDVPDLSRLQKMLRTEDLTLLEYFYGKKSTWAIVLSKENINVVPLPHLSNLNEAVSEFDRAVSLKEDANYRSLARKFYTNLIEPLEKHIHTEQLLVISDGPLNLLPFEALLTDEIQDSENYSDYPYLLKKYTISYLPSVSMSAFVSNEKENTFRDTFAAFAPVFSGKKIGKLPSVASRNNWGALPSTRYEVEEIAEVLEQERSLWTRITGDKSTRVYLENDATESQFKSTTLQNYRYLHLATHAFASDTTSGRAGIAFHPESGSQSSEDGILYAEEIYGLNLNNELVVLSACETGTGEVRTGEGIIGLSRAFQYAGADNLLVSLWSVEDRSTARLMISFYKQLQEGVKPSIALQLAKQDLVESYSYAHPGYWSPFIFIGN